MNRITTIIRTVGMSVLMALTFAACSEKEEVGEYDNWQVRNQHYVDSIASVCQANADGKWEKFVAYNLNDTVEAANPNTNHYVYVHKEVNGTGTYSPLFNDTVRYHYMGRLIPSTSYPSGYIFDKSYSTYSFNEATDVPTKGATKGFVTGFTTALLHMKEGDRWTIYIPYYLGYGSTTSSGIPGYSLLIFDVQLAKIYKYMIDTDTTWY